jgi:scyllo-inositol 2-dehydrogenase (NADP+)
MARVNHRQDSPLQVGLVGFGMAGRVFHAPLIHANPNLRLSYIVQRHGEEAKASYPEAHILRNLDELLARPDVDLLIVATPNVTHFEIASRSLKAGKHVVVDKPFTITSRDADELIKLAHERGLVLSTFQNRRWDGDFRTVRQVLEQRLVGRLAIFESRFDRFRPAVRVNAWREESGPGSGLLYDLGPHLLDQAVMLFGPPEGIQAETRRLRDGAAADDTFDLHLEYPRLQVQLSASLLMCEPSPRFTLYGTEGSYVKYGLDPQEEALKKGGTPGLGNWGVEPEAAWGTVSRCDRGLQRQKYRTLPGCYQEYYENVYRAIRGLDDLAVTPEQARDLIRLIEIAIRSSQEKRTIAVP